MDYDTIIRELTRAGAKAYPAVTFRFGTKYSERDSTYQVTMTRDSGDRVGEVLFCQGEGKDTSEAANKLADSFIGMLVEKNEKLAKDTAAIVERATKTTELVQEAIQMAQAVKVATPQSSP